MSITVTKITNTISQKKTSENFNDLQNVKKLSNIEKLISHALVKV